MKNILKDKKGLDFNLASGIVFGVVSFTIIVIIGLMILGTTTEISSGERLSFTYTNQSDNTGNIVYVNETGYTLTGVNSTTADYTIVAIWGSYNQLNATGTTYAPGSAGYNVSIALANATTDSSGILTNATLNVYPNVSLTYSYTDQGSQEYLESNLKSNVTSGLNTVVAKFPTIFTIIAIAIVLSVIAFLVIIVRKIGFSGMSGNFGQ
jgi:hypothetical protein